VLLLTDPAGSSNPEMLAKYEADFQRLQVCHPPACRGSKQGTGTPASDSSFAHAQHTQQWSTRAHQYPLVKFRVGAADAAGTGAAIL